MSTYTPNKLEPNFLTRNIPTVAQMLRRGWLGWSILAMAVIGVADLLFDSFADDILSILLTIAMLMLGMQVQLLFAKTAATATYFSVSTTLSTLPSSVIAALHSVKYYLPLLIGVAVVLYPLSLALSPFFPLEAFKSLTPLSLKKSLIICAVLSVVANDYYLLVLLRAEHSHTSLQSIKEVSECRSQNRNEFTKISVVTAGTVACVSTGFLVVGSWALLPLPILACYQWRLYQELFTPNTGLPSLSSAPSLTANASS